LLIYRNDFFLNKIDTVTDSNVFSFVDLINNETIYISNSFTSSNDVKFLFFFKNYKIDVPKCFKKSTSLLNTTNNFFFLKFVNHFMRSGLKHKSIVYILTSLMFFLKKIKIHNSNLFFWKDFYISLKNYFNNFSYSENIKLQNVNTFLFKNNASTDFKYPLTSLNILKNIIWINKSLFEPLFIFYIYKISKNIYKNTRGKSGKYLFIWKYIPSYKRTYLIFYWILRELKLKNGRYLINRFLLLFETIIHNPKQTWVYKMKKFSHNYVFLNAKYTLGRNYRTVKN